MHRLDEDTRPSKWLKRFDTRWRPRWAKISGEISPMPAPNDAGVGPKDPFAEHLGIRFFPTESGTVGAELTVATKHLTHQGMVHGGVLYTMAEAVLTKASTVHGVAANTLDVSVSFAVPARMGDRLRGVAEEVVLRRRTAVYTVKIKNQHDELVAVFQATALRMA